MKKFWRKYHKWVGLFFSFFILMFCFSGIILNHRGAFSECEISRSWMPKDYHFENWNNGIIRGTFKLPNGEVLCFGNAGVWKTDSCFSAFKPLNEGLKKGIDNWKISNMVRLPDGSVWCAGFDELYRLTDSEKWIPKELKGNEERISDITVRNDTLVVLTRSHVYEALAPYHNFTCHELPEPEGYAPKTTLFRTVWMLHSGELFGLPGQLFVDCMALVFIALCITGVAFTFIPKLIKWRKRKNLSVKRAANTLKFSTKWHNNLGKWLIIPTVFLAVTGMSLRPPLMIPLAICSVKPLPGSTLDSENPWHDKLRGIRWDKHLNCWLMSTSVGFYQLVDFTSVPKAMPKAPGVSPMGINVFHPCENGEWLIGSFSGLFRWNPKTEMVTDYFTDKPIKRTFGRPIGSVAVSGFSTDLAAANEVIFEYNDGARTKTEHTIHLAGMPQMMVDMPMSLWNFALELHVGRCYTPFLGPISVLFVFLAGLLLTLTLISGYIVRPKKRKK